MFSSVILVFDTPLIDPNSNLAIFNGYIEIILTTVFTLEGILKIIAFGFLFNGETSYILNPWNIMDFIIIIISVLLCVGKLNITDIVLAQKEV